MFISQSLGDESLHPAEWIPLFKNLSQIESFGRDAELPDTHLSLLKRSLVIMRRIEAERTLSLQNNTVSAEVKEKLESRVAAMDALLGRTELQKTKALEVPSVTDYFSTKQVINDLSQRIMLSPRAYDEKFGTLISPSLFFSDLEKLRLETDVRGTFITVAYIDIDDFKSVNTEFTETVVDRKILPIFMRRLEADVCFHGHAYRQGGDEYLVILPGFSPLFAIHFLDHIRASIERLGYPGLKRKLTVSIGACSVNADSPFTNLEIQQKANEAKNYAKKHGKNRCAYYTTTDCEVSSLECTSNDLGADSKPSKEATK